MKKLTMALVFLGILMFGFIGSAAAGENPVWVNVPFAFHVGKALLPAGEYLFNMAPVAAPGGYMLKIVNRDGSMCEYVLSQRIDGFGRGTDFNLYFNRYGDSYFLRKVKGYDLGTELAKSRIEKAVAAEYLQALTTVGISADPAVSRKAK